jgi:hypothetical protein
MAEDAFFVWRDEPAFSSVGGTRVASEDYIFVGMM